MKDVFKTRGEDEIVAKMIFVREGASLPLFSRAILRAYTVTKYKGIPVFILDGYMLSYDYDYGEVNIVGEITDVSDLEVMKTVSKSIKAIDDIDLSRYAKAGFAFIIVYASSDFRNYPFDKTDIIEFTKLSKLKIRGKTLKLEGTVRKNVNDLCFEVSPIKADDDDLDTKSFVIDNEKGDIV